ncbi:hypothetical protein FA15DRAFT_752560 [Coprinopsis marcescibilis]|uniref:Uncharacterized protein n=1 Tax=Coprinopsis marcescibilis TaxID=230819 RepID=A0A5C3LL93_COPMA|nr:hypothetical protein FA15DRAFT_752560 [Coprinopsis marcescibilis]
MTTQYPSELRRPSRIEQLFASFVKDYGARFNGIPQQYGGYSFRFDFGQDLLERRPIFALFSVTWTLLCAIPFGLFLAAVIFTALGLVVAAVGFVLITGGSALMTYLTLLLTSIGVLGLISGGLTISVVVTFVFYRLASLTRQEGINGAYRWFEEIRLYIQQSFGFRSSIPPDTVDEETVSEVGDSSSVLEDENLNDAPDTAEANEQTSLLDHSSASNQPDADK